jgi:hypothetical protein
MSVRLWEAQHAYYCEEQNYFAGRDKTVRQFNSWADFISEFGDADPDYNLLFRWDWKPKDEDAETYDPTAHDENCRDGELYVHWMGQRKGLYFTSVVAVCRADEPAVRAFLRPRLEHLKKLWEPLS